MNGPKLICCACGEVEVGVCCPMCPPCWAAYQSHSRPDAEPPLPAPPTVTVED
jgi:hypothetical protein